MNIYSLIRFLKDLQMKYQNKFQINQEKNIYFFFVYMRFNINVNEKEYCLYCLNSIHDHVFWKLVDILKENSWKFNAKQLYSEATEKKNTRFTKPFTII